MEEREFSILKELIGKGLARHGVERIAVKPYLNYVQIQDGERHYQRAWNFGSYEWNFIAEAAR